MPQDMIEVVGLKKYFQINDGSHLFKKIDIRAVDDLNLTIRQGEIIGIIGESGSGKTTLARVILGLIKPTGGKVLFEGADITSMDRRTLKELRSKIAVVFQDPMSNLNPREDVKGSIMRPLLLHGVSRTEALLRAIEALKKVKMDERYLKSYPHQLSGGQLQRIAIARALVMNPKLMILDEPTSALDISVQAQVLNILLDLQKESGITYLMITHDLNAIRYVSDRVAVMYLGQLVEYGTTEAVFDHGLHPYTQGLMVSAPVTDPTKRSTKERKMSGEPGSLIHAGDGCHFADRCPHSLDICRAQRPEIKQANENHFCACFINTIQ